MRYTDTLRLALLSLLLITSSVSWGQSDQLIQSRLIDAVTKQPLPFATISVADGSITNETNADGYFMLHLPARYQQDTLTVLALDYKSVQLPLAHLPPSTIQLTSLPSQAEVLINDTYFSFKQPFSARDTLLKAVASFARNYSNKPTLSHGFYRETIKPETGNFFSLYAEGTVDIYKQSYYFTKKDDQIRFIKGRRKPLTTLIIPVLTPGPWASTMLDIVKYQEFLFHNGTINNDYEFELAGKAMMNNRLIHIIHFKPHRLATHTGYFVGNLFVEAGSLAIIRAEYELATAGLSLLNKLQYTSIYGATLQKRRYVATYTIFEGRWSFQGGSVENTFSQKNAAELYTTRIDFVVTKRQSANVKPFRPSELADYKTLPMAPFDKTSDTFWDGESYLLPTLPLPALIKEPGKS